MIGCYTSSHVLSIIPHIHRFVFSMFDQDEDEQLNETELSDFANVLNNFCMLGCEKVGVD